MDLESREEYMRSVFSWMTIIPHLQRFWQSELFLHQKGDSFFVRLLDLVNVGSYEILV